MKRWTKDGKEDWIQDKGLNIRFRIKLKDQNNMRIQGVQTKTEGAANQEIG